MKFQFSREYKDWHVYGKDHLMIVYVQSYGDTVEHLVANAQVTLEKANGSSGPDWDLDDLPDEDRQTILSDLIDFYTEGAI